MSVGTNPDTMLAPLRAAVCSQRAMHLQDGWDSFEGWSEGKPARVELDMRLAEQVPIESRPWLLRVRVPIASASSPVVDALIASVRARHEAVLIARLTTDDALELVLHGTRHEHLKDAAASALARFPGHRAQVRSAHDSSWLHVRERILPNKYQAQWMHDRRVVDAMRQGGDRIDQPRPIDHTVYFRSVESREAFVKGVRALGFESDAATDSDGHLRFGLIVRRRDPVTLDHIHAVACELIEHAEEAGGQYDGWGAPFVDR
ncbi:MAG: DUF695 domain-containing protein [Myxococcota bacterium]|nr:DUF695 domain-containing protein [Myxococcota bacterium]